MKLTPKQRAILKGLANPIKERYRIGKNGLDENVYALLDHALEAKELIKVEFLPAAGMTPAEGAAIFEEKLGCGTVGTIGKIAILYRPSKKNPKIIL